MEQFKPSENSERFESKESLDRLFLGRNKKQILTKAEGFGITPNFSLGFELEQNLGDLPVGQEKAFFSVSEDTVFDGITYNALAFTDKHVFICLINDICVGYLYKNPNNNKEVSNLPRTKLGCKSY